MCRPRAAPPSPTHQQRQQQQQRQRRRRRASGYRPAGRVVISPSRDDSATRRNGRRAAAAALQSSMAGRTSPGTESPGCCVAAGPCGVLRAPACRCVRPGGRRLERSMRRRRRLTTRTQYVHIDCWPAASRRRRHSQLHGATQRTNGRTDGLTPDGLPTLAATRCIHTALAL